MVQFIIRVKFFISSYFYFCFYHYKIIILNIVVKRKKQLHVMHVSAIEVYRVWLLLLGNLRSNDARATRTSLKKSVCSLLVFTRAVTLSNVGEPNLRTISQFRVQKKRNKISSLLVFVLHKTRNWAFSRRSRAKKANKCTKRCAAREKLLFCLLNILVFWPSRCRRVFERKSPYYYSQNII